MKVDDRVTPIRPIIEHFTSDGLGSCILAKPKDILVIRRFSGPGDQYIHVSHENSTDDKTFWVTEGEVTPCED